MDSKMCNIVTRNEARRVDFCWVLELPIQLLFVILSCLPMQTIFSCRCVCKKFLEILTDPYFAELHFSNSLSVDRNLIVQNKYYPLKFSLAYVSDLEKKPFTKNNHFRNFRPLRNLSVPNIISQSKEKFIAALAGSCNGLLCVIYAKEGRTVYYICNPILDEFMLLPKDSTSIYHGAAFGFCPKTKQYKVVRFVSTLHCEIHTLGEKHWRTIKNVPYPNNPSSFDCSLNGNLHWITTSSDISGLICSLNLETEKLCYIPPPAHFHEVPEKRVSCMRVGEIGGLFCVYYIIGETELEACVMKEYGVQSSWTKEFTVNLVFDFERRSTLIAPLVLLSNGDLLICYSFSSLVYYNFRKGTFGELVTIGCHDVVAHSPSFISLKDIAGDKYVEIVRRK